MPPLHTHTHTSRTFPHQHSYVLSFLRLPYLTSPLAWPVGSTSKADLEVPQFPALSLPLTAHTTSLTPPHDQAKLNPGKAEAAQRLGAGVALIQKSHSVPSTRMVSHDNQ